MLADFETFKSDQSDWLVNTVLPQKSASISLHLATLNYGSIKFTVCLLELVILVRLLFQSVSK